MCAIVGIVSSADSSLNDIVGMLEKVSHRGPDGRGVLRVDSSGSVRAKFDESSGETEESTERIALGHCRLAILDVSKAGLQPMVSRSRKTWICFNGEVYNFRELRDELRASGYLFSTGSDTEVVLAAWEEWGAQCFERFNGMWALAIWDGVKQKLILSRDRFGIKPLYFTVWEDRLIFASEIKGLLVDEAIPRTPNDAVIAAYLKFGMVNHSNETFFQDIQAFPAGHYAEVDWNEPGSFVPIRFWELKVDDQVSLATSAEEASEVFRHLFNSSIQLQMRSDVPVGACLSGGLDSSAIVCSATQLGVVPRFNTFTSGSVDKRFDERKWSDMVNSKTGSLSHVVIPDQDGFLSDLRSLMHVQDEPFTTASIYAQFCVMREASRAKVPVLLDGQGADEALCGYRKFYFFYLHELTKNRKYRRACHELLQLIRYGDRKALHLWEGKRYLPQLFSGSKRGMANLISSTFRSNYDGSHLPLGAGVTVQERQNADVLQFSVPSLLRYEDRNSMAFSIESRVPFLDHRIVEFLCSLPTEYKLNKGRTKEILRRSMRGTVPDAILDRRDKVGFVTPQQVWMRDRLGVLIRERFRTSEERISRWIDTPKLISGFEEFMAGRLSENYSEYFRIFILDLWIEELKLSS